MANQTITSDANHDDLTGRNSGENITCQQFATLTLDSEPQHTQMGLMGSFTLTAGTLNIDARNVRHLDYNGTITGTITAGDIVTGATSAAYGEVLRDLTGTLKLRSVTGTFQDDEALNSNNGWSATANGTQRLGTLEILLEEFGGNISCTRQSNININGDWIELGTSDGTANQTFTNWHANFTCGVWVETAVGTNQYKPWANYASSLVNNVAAGVFGNFVNQSFGSATIAFGDAVWGNVPPNGVKIRVPNLVIGMAALSAPTTPILSGSPTIKNFPAFFGNGAVYDVNVANLVVDWVSTNAFSINLVDVGVSARCISNQVSGATDITRSVICRVPGMAGTTSYSAANAGLSTLTDSVFFANGLTNNVTALLQNNSRVIANGCQFIVDNPTNFSDRALYLISSSNSLIENCDVLPIALIDRCSNTILRNIRGGLKLDASDSINPTSNIEVTDSSSTEIDNLKPILDYCIPATIKVRILIISNSINTTVKNMGSYDNRVDVSGYSIAIDFENGSKDGVITNCHFANLGTSIVAGTNNSSGLITQNCSNNGVTSLNMAINNAIALSYKSPSSFIGDESGVETDYASVFDQSFHSIFSGDSDTEGQIAIVFNEKISVNNLYQIINGNQNTIYFNNSGDLSLTAINDEIEYLIQSPIADNDKILGHSAFQNAEPLIRRAGTQPPNPASNLEYTYDLDTGSDFSGVFKTLNGTNLSSETISPDGGFRMKLRIKCLVAGVGNGNLINGIGILTTTTLAAQRDNLYSVRPTVTTISAPNLASGTRVQIYNVTQDTELDNSIAGTNGYSVSLTSGLTSGDNIRLRASYNNGQSYKRPILALAGFTGSNIEFVNSQSDWTELNSFEIDGSAVSEFSADVPNLQIDAADVDGQSQQRRIVAFWAYFITTADGIRHYFGAITLEDTANARIETNVVNLKLQNVGTVPLLLTDDDFRLYTSDGTNPIAATGNTAAITWQTGKIYIAESGTSGLTTSESTILSDLNNRTLRVDGLLEDSNGDRFTSKALESSPGGSGGGDATLTNQSTIISTLSAIQGATYDPATDSLESLRDRGDSAWVTGTPIDAAEIRSAVGLSSANLDAQIGDIPTNAEFNARTLASEDYFDPANDLVAHVALVDSVTTNADMRGTDGANTIVPDNTGIAAIPTNPLRSNDVRLNNLDASISSRSSHSEPDLSPLATAAAVSAIPVNPLLANDIRLDNLNAPIGNIPTVTQFENRTLPSTDYFNPGNDTVAHVSLVDSVTANVDMRGTDEALTSLPSTVPAGWVNEIQSGLGTEAKQDNIIANIAAIAPSDATLSNQTAILGVVNDISDLFGFTMGHPMISDTSDGTISAHGKIVTVNETGTQRTYTRS